MRVSLFILLNVFSAFSYAGPGTFSYQGQIIKPDGFALEATTVTFTVEILSPAPNSCVLYRETHVRNMAASNGIFAIDVGDGTRSGGSNYANNPANTLATALSNSTGLITPLTCLSGNSYTPTTADSRELKVYFNDGSGTNVVAQNHTIHSVPYAQNANALDGVTADQLLLERTDAGNELSQANLENVFTTANHTELLALLAGTSSTYLSATPAADFDMNSNKMINVATPTAAGDATNKSYVDGSIGGSTADAGLATLAAGDAGQVLTWDGAQWTVSTPSSADNTKLPLAGGTMTGAIDMNGQDLASANDITSATVTTTGAVAAGTTLASSTTLTVGTDANVGGNATVTGNIGVGGDANITGSANVTTNVIVSGGIGVATGINSDGAISLHNEEALQFGSGAFGATNYVGFKAPAALGADTIWTLPSADGGAGEVLSTDGSGVLSWVDPASLGAVASVFGRTGTVTANAGDYTASEVTNVAAGNIAAVTVQAAINELDTEKVDSARTITAGAGLTGGGDLSADKTLDVGAGTGIAVAADSISVDIASVANKAAAAVAADSLLIVDSEDTNALKEITRANFLSGYLAASIGNSAGDVMGADAAPHCDSDEKLEMSAGPFYSWSCVAESGGDHGTLTGLTDDDHTQYALLAGRSGGQSLIGGTDASDTLTLESTSDATKGDLILQPNGGTVAVGTTTPSGFFHVDGGAAAADTAGSSIYFDAQNATGPSGNTGGSFYFSVGDGAGGWGSGLAEFDVKSGSFIVSRGSNAVYSAGTEPETHINFTNGWAVDGNSLFIRHGVRNAANVQGFFTGAIANAGGGVYTPSYAWVQQTGAATYSEVMRIDQTGNLNLNEENELRFQDTTGGEYIGFKAPAVVTSSITFELPDGDGAAGEVLSTDGSGVLSWIDPSSVGAVASVFGRSGTVTANAGDYTASEVTNVPAGNVAAVTVQAAINELDSEKVGTARAITAGAGLTGGGDLSADRTLNVGAGTGISVAADSISVDIAGVANKAAAAVAADSLLIVDSEDTNALKEITRANFLSGYLAASIGTSAGDVMGADAAPHCDSDEKLEMSAGPVYSWSCVAESGGDHGTLTGLTDDDHTQYALLAGRSGGQSLLGGTDASDNLTLESTSDATKGDLILQPNGGYVGIGTSGPLDLVDIVVPTGVASGIRMRSTDVAHGVATIVGHTTDTVYHMVTGSSGGVTQYAYSASAAVPAYGLLGVSYTAPTAGTPTFNFTAMKKNGASMSVLSSTDMVFEINNGNTSLMSVMGDGKIGVGTISPVSSLDVSGAITSRPLGTATGETGQINLRELAASGTNTVTIRAPDALASDLIWTLPTTNGSSGNVLTTDGSGVLSWVAPSAATTVSASAGTAAAPSMSFSGDTDTGLYSSAADTIGFTTGGTNRFNLSSAGLVSTTTGGGLVTNAAGSASAPTFSFSGDADTGWFSPATNTLAAATGGTERVRIDSSGNVGIGTNNPQRNLHVEGADSDAKIMVLNSSSTAARYPAMEVVNYSGGFAGVPRFSGTSYRGDSATPAPVQAGDFLFALEGAGGSDAAWNTNTTAQILMTATQTYSATAGGSSISFRTTPDNSVTMATRMRISQDGNVGVGTTSPGTLLSLKGDRQLFSIGGGGYAHNLINLDSSEAPGNNRPIISIGSNAAAPIATFGGGYEGLWGTTFEVRTDISEAGAPGTGFSNLGQALVIKRVSQDGGVVNVASVIDTSSDLSIQPTSGNVGIGTINPSAKLNVNGNSSLEGTVLVGKTGSEVGALSLRSTSGRTATISMNNGTDTTISNTFGNINIVPTGNTIISSGNVGIGTMTPGTLLDISGAITSRPLGTATGETGQIKLRELAASGTNTVTIRAPDTLASDLIWTLPTANGSSGNVLTTNGSGVLSWAAPSAASSVSASAGTAAAPSMSFSGDTNTGIYSSAADTIGFTTGGTNRFNLSSAGLVSTTTGGGLVTTAAGSAAAPTFSFAGDADTGWYRAAADTLAASTAGSERMRIDLSGNVGIGTASPGSKLEVAGNIASYGDGNYSIISSTSYGAESGYAPYFIAYSARGTKAAPTFPQSGDGTASFEARSIGVTGSLSGAGMRTVATETHSTSAMGTEVRFRTVPNTTKISVDRMTITQGGNVGIGATSPGNLLHARRDQDATTSAVVQNATAGAASKAILNTINDLNKYANYGIMSSTFTTGNAYVADAAVLSTNGAGGLSISSDTANPIRFYTNGSERARFSSTGEFSIGTTSSSAMLNVAGSADIGSGTTGSLRIQPFTSALTDIPGSTFGTQFVGAGNAHMVFDLRANDTGDGFYFRVPTDPVSSNTPDKTAFVIKGDGKVGVGTIIPTSRLEVVSATSGNRYVRLAQDDTESGAFSGGVRSTFRADDNTVAPNIVIENLDSNASLTNGTSIWSRFSYSSGSNSPISAGKLLFGKEAEWTAATSTQDSYFSVSTTLNGTMSEKFRISSAGNVGVGTTNPQSPLHVIGDLRVGNPTITNAANSDLYVQGLLEVNSGIFANDGIQVSPSYKFIDDPNTGMYSPADDTLGFSTGAVERMRIDSSGNVGIGTATPDKQLTVSSGARISGVMIGEGSSEVDMAFPYESIGVGSGMNLRLQSPGSVVIHTGMTATEPDDSSKVRFYVSPTGDVGIGTSGPSYKLDVNGTIRGFGITDSSDRRLKKEINPLDGELERILGLQGVSYYWREVKDHQDDKQIGFIAQDVEEIYPELVETDKDGMKSVNYSHLVAPIVEAIKELYFALTDLKSTQDAQSRDIASKVDKTSFNRKIQALELENSELKKREELNAKRIKELEDQIKTQNELLLRRLEILEQKSDK